MKISFSKAKELFLATGMALGWFAVIFQFYLIIINRSASLLETILRFFSFFTILTNILVALCFTLLLLTPGTKWGRFFSRTSTQTALTIYISVVGLVYNVILRFLWSPHGWQALVDELLHLVIPLLFILYWIIFVPKEKFTWKSILPWLIYPAAYCVFALLRGELSGFYPYPFIDAAVLGYKKVGINITGIILVFIVVSLVFVSIARLTITVPNKNRH